MRRIQMLLSGVTLLSLSTSALLAQRAPAPVNVRRAIESSNLATTTAFNGGTPRAFAVAYAATAMFMPPNGKAVTGTQAISDAWQGAWDSGFRNIRVTTSDVITRGDIAVETGTYSGDIQPKAPGGAVGHDTGKYVVVWQRNARGKWMIIRDIYNSDMPAR